MSGRSSAPIHSSESFADETICAILKPIQQEKMTVEYVCQYQAIADFKQRLFMLESHFGEIYSKLTALEKKVAQTLAQSGALSRSTHLE
jgi:hypothetical protein